MAYTFHYSIISWTYYINLEFIGTEGNQSKIQVINNISANNAK